MSHKIRTRETPTIKELFMNTECIDYLKIEVSMYSLVI